MPTLKEFIAEHGSTLFYHAFGLAQDAVNQKDGGVADIWDETEGKYGSTFANKCGGAVFDAILEKVSQSAVPARLQAAPEPTIAQYVTDAALLDEEQVAAVASDVAKAWLGFLATTFPEVDGNVLSAHSPVVAHTFEHYLRSERNFAIEYGGPAAPAEGARP